MIIKWSKSIKKNIILTFEIPFKWNCHQFLRQAKINIDCCRDQIFTGMIILIRKMYLPHNLPWYSRYPYYCVHQVSSYYHDKSPGDTKYQEICFFNPKSCWTFSGKCLAMSCSAKIIAVKSHAIRLIYHFCHEYNPNTLWITYQLILRYSLSLACWM